MELLEFMKLNASKGYHWFESGTIEFFGSRISNWDENSGLFITSEQPPHGDRSYTIRQANFETGQVSTIGEFCQYDSKASALAAMNKLYG